MHRFMFTIVFFGKRKDNTHITFYILKMKEHLRKEQHLKMKADSKTYFENENKFLEK